MNLQTKSLLLVSILLLLPRISNSQMVIPPEQPKLIVQVVVSQLRYDYLQRYAEKLSDNGFKHLTNDGAFCKNSRFNYMLTQSSPGMATISTGTTPSVHGIISNKWYSRYGNAEVDAVADEKCTTIGGSFFSGKFSPKNLITSTYGDEIRMVNPRSKVIGISLEPASAILSCGHNANGVFWIDNERGKWISSNHYLDSLPSWVDTFNVKGLADLYIQREWQLLNDISKYDEADTSVVKEPAAKKRIGEKLKRMLKGLVQPKSSVKNYALLNENPFGNIYTKDFAIAAIVGEELGKDENTDLLTVTFTSTRKIGQKYGPHSIEMEDALLRLDKEIAHFIEFLNYEVGKQNYLLILTSDHGIASTPEHLEKSKIPGGYFDPRQAIALLSSYMNVVYGVSSWVSGYHEKQIFLNRKLIEDSNLNLYEVQSRVADFMLQFTGVANAATGNALQMSNFTNGVFEKLQNSYNQRRSGDVIINLEPGWVEKNGHVTSSNSPYTYDTHVPLIFYGWKMKREQILTPVNMSDIAPTISTLIGISWPNGATGKPIREIID